MSPTQRLFAIIGICIGISIGGLSFSMYNLCFANIKLELHASLGELQWMLNAFGIVIASLLVTMGRLADIYGRKRVYLSGIGLTVVGLFIAGSALSPGWIIVSQVFMGIASAIILPVSQAMVADLYPDDQRGHAIGIWAAFVGVSMALGPLYSGLIIDVLSWRWVFYIMAPIALLAFILVAITANESRNEHDAPSLDIKGSALLMLTIACFITAVVQGASWRPAYSIALYILSAASLVALLLVEKKVKSPIIRKELFTNRMFLLASLADFCFVGLIWTTFFLVPLFLQLTRHFTPLQAGLTLLLVSIPSAIIGPFAGKWYHRLKPRLMMSFGFVLLIVSVIIQLFYHPSIEFKWIALATVLVGIAWGFIWGPATTAAISTLSKHYGGIAAGTFNTFQEIGGGTVLAISVVVVRLHHNFAIGYHEGMWVLLVFCVLGLFCSLALKSS